jgi:hypothetical protein
MDQAFIIMQIENSQLDAVCAQAIVPALKTCGFDPKRVDKHNSGGLLKSEIVTFLESAGLIIADLTNERPNCYLEVGYTMGINKFKQLILTAREDHNPSSPNYKVAGPKIHFDLSGYDICFWDPERIDDFRKELEKRIRRRQLIVAPAVPVPISPWNEDWLKEQEAVASEGLWKVGLKAFMEVRFALSSGKLRKNQHELLQAMERAVIHTFGWPIGIVMTRPDSRPRPTSDGIRAEVAREINDYADRVSYDYWSLRKDGDFYLLKSLFEDEREPGKIYFNTRIVRITEVFLFCARLYNTLGVDATEIVKVRVRHSGLAGRMLSSVGSRRLSDDYVTSADEVTTDVQTPLSKIESELVSLVKEVADPLFVVFDFFKLTDPVYEDIVNRFVAGQVT